MTMLICNIKIVLIYVFFRLVTSLFVSSLLIVNNKLRSRKVGKNVNGVKR